MAALGHILIVDDDENIVELMTVNLRSEGFVVDKARSAADVDIEALGDIRLIVADSMNASMTGLDLVYELKDNPITEHIAVILYSNIRSERMVIDALDAGADDYIVKPFSLREMIARIKSILRRQRRSAVAPAACLKFEGLTMDVQSQTVKIDGLPVALSKTEYAILYMLLRNMNNFVSRAEIYRRVWPDEEGGNERIVDTNISRLRKKLGDLGARIINRSGHGYMIG
ncbi:MAG: response regulator transcription factor [Muribaculaceae bacterium]|nr:response regulator transcription factor [Muribaculaceae bacterium]